ncbi:MAG: hypothetical protein ACI9CA_001672 [Natronomonas sp.]|jgi:hypothetical protein
MGDRPLQRAVTPDPVSLSEAFLLAVRREEPVDGLAADLTDLDDDRLAAALDTDRARIAFWTNVYNAATQQALAADPGQYDHRRQFFAADLITVAGRSLSLDDIEHGLLRRSYHKYSLGYLRVPRPLRSGFADRHAPDERDPRVHFALNCGAGSCPPVAAYTREAVDDQLDLATRGYLERTVDYDPGAGEALVPRVLLWFRGDFGGKRGVYDFLRRYDQLPRGETPSLSYREWDWSLDLGAYAEREQAP